MAITQTYSEDYRTCTLPPIWNRDAVGHGRRHEGARHARSLLPTKYAEKRIVSGRGYARRSPLPLRQWPEGSQMRMAPTNEKLEITEKERRDMELAADRYRKSLHVERRKAKAFQRRLEKLKLDRENVANGTSLTNQSNSLFHGLEVASNGKYICKHCMHTNSNLEAFQEHFRTNSGRPSDRSAIQLQQCTTILLTLNIAREDICRTSKVGMSAREVVKNVENSWVLN